MRSGRHGVGSRIERAHAAIVLAIVAWGALAFGAVYPWGYGPLAATAAIAGGVGLIAGRRRRLPPLVGGMLAALVAAIMLQLVPLPPTALTRLSPATVALLARYDVGFALSRGAAVHTLSVDPQRTAIGLMLVASLAMFWLGLTAMLRTRVVLWLVPGLLVVGVAMALIGVVAPSGHNVRIYGFWQPNSAATSFGSFVNRNHYAGWMLMTIPLGVGYLFSLIEREMAPRSWRARLAWLSTPAASGAILVAGALTLMTLSVLMSLSRSGICCLAVGLAVVLYARGRALVGGGGRATMAACLVAVVGVCVGWTGADRLGERFEEFRHDSLAGRSHVWHDAASVAGAFPIAGTGFNTFGVAMLFYQSGDLDQWFAEAHSDYLQIAAEGGMLVVAPALAVLAVTILEVRRRLTESDGDPRAYAPRVGAAAGLLAIGLQETVEFSLQMPGNAALFCVLAAIALHRSDRPAARALQISSAA